MKLFFTFICTFLCVVLLAQTTDQDNTLSADRPFITCPVTQAKVKNGSKPNLELCKKMIQCKKGELAASKGYDGAVTVDVSIIETAPAKPWDPVWDKGSARKGTIVYPVKASYTIKTFYRARTTVEANATSIFNFFVDDFGEWKIGFQELVKVPESSVISKN